MAIMTVSGWEGVESFEIINSMALAIGGEPHFAIFPTNGYLYLEVRNNSGVVASSTFSTNDFPPDLAEQDKPRFLFRRLFPNDHCF